MIPDFSLYGAIVGLAFVFFWWYLEKILLSTQKIKRPSSLNWALLLTLVGSLTGARAYHLITDWSLYAEWNWPMLWQTWQGGLGIYGAILGGLLGLTIWMKWQKISISWFALADCAAIAAPGAQAIGRWGNYINQELFGPPTSLWWGILIDPGNRPERWLQASHFHPLFAYESIALASLGVFLYFMWRRFRWYLPLGSRFYSGVYGVTYGTIRFGLEFLRWDSPVGPLYLTYAQWMSILFAVAGLLFLVKSFAYNED
jgi:phosphatidylglycerol:prolipoprotein diacylglycerol transferase